MDRLEAIRPVIRTRRYSANPQTVAARASSAGSLSRSQVILAGKKVAWSGAPVRA